MSAPPTITTLKTNFLSAQTRVLSNPLHPTREWRDANDELPEKQVNDALGKLNHRIQQHSKRVYAPQATRHVAEQIDALYTAHSLPTLIGGDGEEDGISVAADLGMFFDMIYIYLCGVLLMRWWVKADGGVICGLPDQWVDDEGEEDEEGRRRYGELVGRLKELEEERREGMGRVERLRGLRRLLVPFEGAGEGVQGNLVGRNGEVEMELERMRMLLARVGGRVDGLRRRGEVEGEEMEGDGVDGVEGVEGVLGRF
ncbi:kinetochore protein fta4 [Triangularia verruculosa]|uniref:Kinetochore protein fta4 n=1 Tax=Triangularia verruculosa TaxID=2587418 RepID=A0AAN6X8X2_9PEZI|nr:kinetochore protein fta4 [Triangularia verruculosa]